MVIRIVLIGHREVQVKHKIKLLIYNWIKETLYHKLGMNLNQKKLKVNNNVGFKGEIQIFLQSNQEVLLENELVVFIYLKTKHI